MRSYEVHPEYMLVHSVLRKSITTESGHFSQPCVKPKICSITYRTWISISFPLTQICQLESLDIIANGICSIEMNLGAAGFILATMCWCDVYHAIPFDEISNVPWIIAKDTNHDRTWLQFSAWEWSNHLTSQPIFWKEWEEVRQMAGQSTQWRQCPDSTTASLPPGISLPSNNAALAPPWWCLSQAHHRFIQPNQLEAQTYNQIAPELNRSIFILCAYIN